MGRLWVISLLLILCSYPLGGYAASSPQVEAEDTKTATSAEGQVWHELDLRAPQFPPSWHYRYTGMRSIAEDMESLGQDVDLQVGELVGVFTRAQQNLDFLLLDMPRIYRSARESSYTERILQETVWYLELKYGDAKASSETLERYSSTLDEFGEMLRRAQISGTSGNQALAEALPLLLSAHAQLNRQMDGLGHHLEGWLVPAGNLLSQMQEARNLLKQSLPDLWLKYYSTPLRVTYHNWAETKNDLGGMRESLLNSVFFPRQILIILLFDVFVLGGGFLLFRMARQTVRCESSNKDSMRQIISEHLDSLSILRKIGMIACMVCAVNILLDAMPSVHLYVPLIVIQGCIMAVAMGVWSRGSDGDPPLALLTIPVMVGLILLYADAPPLWMVVGYAVVLFLCALWLYLMKGNRSPFCYLWLTLLVLGGLISAAGLGRILIPMLAMVMAFRVGYVVLKHVRQIKFMNNNILGLALFTPFCAALLYSLGLLYIMSCPGITSLVVYWQPNTLEISGLQLQLRNLFFLLMLIPVAVSLGRASQEFLLRAAQDRALLDASAVPVIHAVMNGLLWIVFGLVAMGFMGMDIRSLAFIGGALTVGLGLGLQSIMSNFFCGLVIVFGRVVREGDLVEMDGLRGWVRSVNMRATVIETLDNAVLMVPNLEILNKRVVNWTKNSLCAFENVPIRVRRQENIELVIKTLEEVAGNHPDIQSMPEPRAFLIGFGENSIDFQWRVRIKDVTRRLSILSSLRQNLLSAFAAKGIVMAMPYLDVTIMPPEMQEKMAQERADA